MKTSVRSLRGRARVCNNSFMVPALALVLATALSSAAPAGPAAAASSQTLASLVARADAAYVRRADPAELAAVGAALDEAERLGPEDYEVLWRRARLEVWLADDPSLPKDEQTRLGKRAWDYGERAIRANPARVEGWNYAAAGMGQYALGLGILRALREGLEGKFKDRLSHAEKIDPGFGGGAIQTAWGRFWYELPWPKYDARKSERALKDALGRNPDNVRARVYLADTYRKQGRKREAREQLEKAAADAPGRYDEAEERRWQGIARRKLAE
ncbi:MULTISPECIES: tetratricopeptide repeat protein [Anaeromyxobacter]|uniref:tetratricopeptide repeat protein n=1 Tax=Anaeromyxobacter TaxID=161492 RepID=UPI001F581F5A|nr:MULTISPECIES: tetratricopeptide repeat protein [unclassified Anaeromyxobacter]